MNNNLKIFVFLLIAILLVAGAVQLIGHRKSEMAALDTPPLRPTVVNTATAVKGELPLSRHYLGTVEPVVSAEIAPRSEGHLESVKKDVGDRVEKAEVVAEIDARLARKEKQAIAAELAGAEEELAKRKKELARSKALFAEDHLSEDRLDETERVYSLARARVRRLQAELESAALSLGYNKLLAPFSGVVSERFRDPGDLVKPGQPVYRLENPGSGYRVLVDLPQKTLSGVARGARAVLTHGNREIESTVDRIHPSIHEGRLATAEIKETDPPFGLPSGSRLGVDIFYDVSQGLLVPLDAVLEQAEESFVFSVDGENLAHKHRVTVKGRSGGQAVIDGALSAGDTVVTGNEAMLLQLREGSPVTPLTRGQE